MKHTPTTLQEKESFLLRWPVILAALLLAWPIGIILLITRFIGTVKKTRELKVAAGDGIPFAAHKTAGEKRGYDQCRRTDRKTLLTVAFMTCLFIVLGAIGITGDYRTLFASGFSAVLLRDFAVHALYLLLGLYLSVRAYTLLTDFARQNALCAAVGEERTVSLADLSARTGLSDEQLRDDLDQLIGTFTFGHGAYFTADTLYCWEDEQ